MLASVILGFMRTLEELDKEIRDPRAVWYGPHPCEQCGKIIVKRDHRNGAKLALDADAHNHHYPNFLWFEHVCTPSGLPIGSAGGAARAAQLPVSKRKQIAHHAAQTRWLKKSNKS